MTYLIFVNKKLNATSDHQSNIFQLVTGEKVFDNRQNQWQGKVRKGLLFENLIVSNRNIFYISIYFYRRSAASVAVKISEKKKSIFLPFSNFSQSLVSSLRTFGRISDPSEKKRTRRINFFKTKILG